jgi:pimeloyl-ACP methyl ester carboxylesterase
MTNIILVAGTYFGGWYWTDLAENLRAKGHTVFTPTLSGLGDDSPSKKSINLDDHINDIVKIIEANNLNEVVLVGWSYGGMVITGVQAKTPAKVSHLIYLDAAVPKSGQAEFDIIPEWLKEKQVAECEDGLNQFPSKEFLEYESRMKPHPIGTKTQAIQYDETQFSEIPKTYVVAGNDGENGVFADVVKRIRTEPNWDIIELPVGHDVYKAAPAEVEGIILRTIGFF